MGEPALSIVGWVGGIGLLCLVVWIHGLSEYKARAESRLITLAELQMVRDGVLRLADYPGGIRGSYEIRQDTARVLQVFGAHPSIVAAAASADWKQVNRILRLHVESESEV